MSFTVAREWHKQTTDVLVPGIFVSFVTFAYFEMSLSHRIVSVVTRLPFCERLAHMATQT